MKTKSRIEAEKQTIAYMIGIFCRHKHHCPKHTLCADCQELLAYAHRRLERCKFAEDKSACKRCPIHCYRPDMKERIAAVMRYSGPRMMLYHPILAIKHLLQR